MPRRFAEIAFTPSVRAVQTRYGSRAAYRRLETGDGAAETLSDREIAFIQS